MHANAKQLRLNHKAVDVPTAEFKEDGTDLNKEMRDFYMDGLNDTSRICQYCHAKLFSNEFNEKTKTSFICCANGQIVCDGKSWQMNDEIGL